MNRNEWNVTRIGEDVGVELAVSLGERLHHAVDLLRLSRQSKTPQELPNQLHLNQLDLNQCNQIQVDINPSKCHQVQINCDSTSSI